MRPLTRLGEGARRRGLVAASGALIAVVASSFAPWGTSGEATRTSYELLDVVGRAGLLGPPWDRIAPVWLVVPVLAGAALLAAASYRSRIAGALTGMVGGLACTACLLVLRSPLQVEPGAVASGGAGAVAVLAGVFLTAGSSRRANRQ